MLTVKHCCHNDVQHIYEAVSVQFAPCSYKGEKVSSRARILLWIEDKPWSIPPAREIVRVGDDGEGIYDVVFVMNESGATIAKYQI